MTPITRRDISRALRPLRALVIVGCVATSSCGPVNPPAPVDEDGDRIAQPPPGERWLRLESLEPQGGTPEEPAPLALNPRFEFVFDEYIDEESVPSFEVARLVSGGLSVRGQTTYVMTRKTLVWEPRQDALTPGLIYTLEFRLDALRSATGAPLVKPWPTPSYIVTPEGRTTSMTLDSTPQGWADVAPIFEAHCDRCHSDPQWRLPPMEWFALTHEDSGQVELPLVRPFSPSLSYLMHKLLPDYPDRLYGPHPPEWDAQSAPLDEAQLWTIERWIKAGAPE